MWIDKLQEETQQLEPIAQFVIKKEDVENAIKKTLNWKIPSSDKIHNY